MLVPVFPTLYINSNGKVYEWSIAIEANGPNIFTIVTSHGDKDGKKVVHKKDITEGKAKRSVLEQTVQEVTRKWKNKIEKELYLENLGNVDLSPSAKTIVVRPMLANTFLFDLYSKKSRAYKIPFPAYVQRKYDGIRCISYMKDGNVIIESRKGVAFQNFQVLKEQLKKLFKKLPENFYFDGELYTDKLDFEVISGLIRLHEKTCTKEDIDMINKIEYHVYDFIDLNKLEMPYKERFEFLTKLFEKNVTSSSLIKPVQTFIADELKDVKTYHDDFVKNGFEGAMIRAMDGPYEVNKRSKYLQKFKEFMEEEFKIVGFHEGSGDEKGSVVWDCITKDDKTFAVRPKGTFESRKKLFDDGKKYIGKLLTVIFQEYSGDGVPRFPVGKGIRDIY